MRVNSIRLLEHIMPEGCSGGTGYSQPDRIMLVWADGTKTNLLIDIWYRPIGSIKEVFAEAMGSFNIENFEEAYEMYVDEIAMKSCPWTKEQILNATNNKRNG